MSDRQPQITTIGTLTDGQGRPRCDGIDLGKLMDVELETGTALS
jgi:hypothetical protein